jgi:hypothetical protein
MESTSGGAPATGRRRIAQWRKELSRERDALQAAFLADPDTPKFLREHARLVDRVVTHLWAAAAMPADYALLAVGGYGRAQLYPHSDVDVLVLLPSGADAAGAAAIEAYFASLWDVGLDLAHAVRTIPEWNPEWKPIATAYLGLLLLGGSFISLGLLISSLTKNQIVASVTTFAVFLFLWIIDWIGNFSSPTVNAVTSYLSVIAHFDDFSKGVIDTTHLIYYLSFITFGLFLTAKSVDSERWRG